MVLVQVTFPVSFVYEEFGIILYDENGNEIYIDSNIRGD